MIRYNKLMDGSRVLLGAHRGDRKHYPENTMPAFIAAAEMGCDAIETDVRMTKDGHLVLIHDRDVERTTNATGFVDEMTLEGVGLLAADMNFDGKLNARDSVACDLKYVLWDENGYVSQTK